MATLLLWRHAQQPFNLQELEKRKLRKSKLPISYHMNDLIGAEYVLRCLSLHQRPCARLVRYANTATVDRLLLCMR